MTQTLKLEVEEVVQSGEVYFNKMDQFQLLFNQPVEFIIYYWKPSNIALDCSLT